MVLIDPAQCGLRTSRIAPKAWSGMTFAALACTLIACKEQNPQIRHTDIVHPTVCSAGTACQETANTSVLNTSDNQGHAQNQTSAQASPECSLIGDIDNNGVHDSQDLDNLFSAVIDDCNDIVDNNILDPDDLCAITWIIDGKIQPPAQAVVCTPTMQYDIDKDSQVDTSDVTLANAQIALFADAALGLCEALAIDVNNDCKIDQNDVSSIINAADLEPDTDQQDDPQQPPQIQEDNNDDVPEISVPTRSSQVIQVVDTDQ